MLKTLATASVALTAVSSQQYYGNPQPAYQAPAQPAYGPPQYAPPAQNRYAHYVKFEPASPLIDPSYYAEVLSTFKQCRVHKCSILPRAYSTDIESSIAVIGKYTSCVTGCAAKTMMKAAVDYKNALAHIYDVGANQLVRTRKYLAGEGEYEVIEEKTRIGDSCCLPNDHFAGWDRIMFPVTLKANGDYEFTFPEKDGQTPPPASSLPERMISVEHYLARCTMRWNDDEGDDDGPQKIAHPWMKYLKWDCSSRWVEYLELLRHNVGHLILAPKCEALAPDSACSKHATRNPRAAEFKGDVCIARSCHAKGKTYEMPMPLVKPLTESHYWHQACPSDTLEATDDDGDDFVIKYQRVPRSQVKYYSVIAGLPSLSAPDTYAHLVALQNPDALDCQYEHGFAVRDGDFFAPMPADPTEDQTRAAKLCPYGGTFEYCNMHQYASYLQKQLFDNDACQLSDMHGKKDDDAAFYGTLACLYKVATLKCDCMEAVLNCYKREEHFSDAMASTIGKAASILCGFVLCQRPRVYAYFGGQDAISGANIMRGLLSQVGLSVPSASAFPPATIAFLTFGLGMVAFFVSSKLYKKSRSVRVEDGYRNLI